MEISKAYRYCPICGTQRTQIKPSRPFLCTECGHTSFFGPVTAVGAVVANEQNEVLLIERAREPGKGKLGMPGGFVDPFESAEAAARRELQEELEIEVAELHYLMTAFNSYSYHGIVYPVLDIFFHTEPLSDQTIRGDSSEVATWIWTKLTENVLDRMAFDSNRKALEYYQHREECDLE